MAQNQPALTGWNNSRKHNGPSTHNSRVYIHQPVTQRERATHTTYNPVSFSAAFSWFGIILYKFRTHHPPCGRHAHLRTHINVARGAFTLLGRERSAAARRSADPLAVGWRDPGSTTRHRDPPSRLHCPQNITKLGELYSFHREWYIFSKG
jgi:hypothetical protein